MKNRPYFIDSCTILTPLDEFDFINKELTDPHALVNLSTMEIKDENKQPIYYEDKNGVKFRVSIVSFFGDEYLRITYTSKMLGRNYFDGLYLGNFKSVFDRVMTLIECSISYSHYMTVSKINDIDIAGDFFMSSDTYEAFCAPFSKLKGAKTFTQKLDYMNGREFVGVQLVNRSDASISHPFLKIYSKKAELLSRSEDFYKLLILFDVKILDTHRRLEVTIKNKKHLVSVFKRCKIPIDDFTPSFVLSLSQSRLKDILNHITDRYRNRLVFSPTELDLKKLKKLTPSQYMLGRFAYELLKEGHTVQHLINMFDDNPSATAGAKSRLSKRIKGSVKEVAKMHDLKNLKVSLKDAFL